MCDALFWFTIGINVALLIFNYFQLQRLHKLNNEASSSLDEIKTLQNALSNAINETEREV